jgi:hypothetical protein
MSSPLWPQCIRDVKLRLLGAFQVVNIVSNSDAAGLISRLEILTD